MRRRSKKQETPMASQASVAADLSTRQWARKEEVVCLTMSRWERYAERQKVSKQASRWGKKLVEVQSGSWRWANF